MAQHVCCMYAVCMPHIWCMYGVCMADECCMQGVRTIDVCCMHAAYSLHLLKIRRMYGACMLHGCQTYGWKPSGNVCCMEVTKCVTAKAHAVRMLHARGTRPCLVHAFCMYAHMMQLGVCML